MNISFADDCRKGLRISFALGLILCAHSVRGIDQQPTVSLYRLTDLGPFDTASSQAYSINADGDVVLHTTEKSIGVTSSVWKSASSIAMRLETLGEAAGYAYAINNRGIVAGYVVGKDADHACLWDQGKFIELSKDPHAYSQAYALNNAGDVVGIADLDNRYGRAFLWKRGKMTDLGTLSGGNSCAYGINDKEEMVGYSLTAYEGVDWYYEAVLWREGKITDLGMKGVAYAINNHGLVVGVEEGTNGSGFSVAQAFSWQADKPTILGTLGGTASFAYAVNDSGEIVGAATTSTQQLHATLWTNSKVFDLNTVVAAPGWELIEARGINAKGQIVGVGLTDGKQHGFLLTPSSNSSSTLASPGKVGVTPSFPSVSPQTRYPEQTAVRRRIDPVKVVISKPVSLKGVECQTIVQAVWKLPEKNPHGNLNVIDENNHPSNRLASDGQTNLFLAMRFTNRSSQPIYLSFFDVFVPAIGPNEPAEKEPILNYTVPPRVTGLVNSPLLAPGQSFTLSRPARLAWNDKDLNFECLSVPGETRITGLGPGKYSLLLSYQDQGSVRPDSPYETLEGSVDFNIATIEIR